MKAIPEIQFFNPRQTKPFKIRSRLKEQQAREIFDRLKTQEDRSVQYRIEDIKRYGTETEISHIAV